MKKEKTKECPSCAMDVSSNLTTCPICGYEFPSGAKWVSWVAALLVVVVLLYLIF